MSENKQTERVDIFEIGLIHTKDGLPHGYCAAGKLRALCDEGSLKGLCK